ncbi:MAG: aminotransferase class I/II-fold pyridoxal phosphate-dependent enzyme [Dysosmobacter sp.]
MQARDGPLTKPAPGGHRPRTKLIVFNNPCNPTGMGYDRSTLELLGRVAEEHDLLIAADEIHTTSPL